MLQILDSFGNGGDNIDSSWMPRVAAAVLKMVVENATAASAAHHTRCHT